MCQSMFDRLLALFMAVILLMALISAGFSVFSIRGAMVNSRMEGLLVQAREIAYLAANLDSSSVWTTDESTMNYLQWKARNVYEDYGAYLLIVDRSGHVMDNMQAALQDSTGDMLQSLNSEELSQLMLDVLKGKEVQKRITNASRGAIMTVAVPYVQDDTVQGAVLIHTSAQVIEAPYHALLLQVLIGFTLAAFVAIAGTALYTRGIIRPLTVITHAAEKMSKGELSARASVTGVNEVRQLAGAFNVMAAKKRAARNLYPT